MFVTSSTKKHGWKWGNEIPSHIVSSTNRYQNSFHTSNDKYYANINERLSNVQQNCSIYMLGNYSFDTLLVILHQNLYLLNEKSRVKIRDWITRLYCFTKKSFSKLVITHLMLNSVPIKGSQMCKSTVAFICTGK